MLWQLSHLTHAHRHEMSQVYGGFAVCAGSTELAMALRALGERHGLSGLRVWRLFAGRTQRHEQHPPQYMAGRPACAALRVWVGTEQ